MDPLTLASLGIAGAGALVGGLFGSDSNDQKSTTTTQPWSAQQPYIKYGMQDNAYQYAKLRGSPWFTGDLYANLDPRSIAGLEGIYGYAGNNGDAAAIRGAAPGLIASGAGVSGAANRLLDFNPADPTASNINSAGLYANNPFMDGIIDAASRDVTRNLNEDVLPQIARSASAGGNINSNKRFIKEGIAERGAADRIADISAGLRGDAYATGLDLAERARTTNMGLGLEALSQGGSLADRALARGFDAVGQGRAFSLDDYDQMLRAGGIYQADKQGDLTAAFDQWQGNDQRSYDLLNRYFKTMGSGWGGTTTTSTPTSVGGWQGALQGALGGAASGLGLYGSFRNINASAPAATGGNPYWNMGTGGLY